MDREILSFDTSEFDLERISSSDLIFAVLDKNQESILEITGNYAHKIWLCLRMQESFLNRCGKIYETFYKESNCHGTASFIMGDVSDLDLQRFRENVRRSREELCLSLDETLLTYKIENFKRDITWNLNLTDQEEHSNQLSFPLKIALENGVNLLHSFIVLGMYEDTYICFDKKGYSHERWGESGSQDFRVITLETIMSRYFPKSFSIDDGLRLLGDNLK